MKKTIFKIITISYLMLLSTCVPTYAQNYENNMNAAWITTVYNKDWPKNKSNIDAQKKEIIEILDKLKDTGIDTVIFQARPKGDALYRSNINPWSDVLTGTQGKDPGYDPLAYVINQAKLRNMKVHVWLNPYRVTTTGTDLSKLSLNHPARNNPNWVISYNNRLYYNPELKEVKQHIVDTVSEIVKNYDIDGIHFDDYFYPEDYPLPKGEGKDGYLANKRRDHINEMILNVKNEIKTINREVKFGVSPRGIWKNKSSDPKGSDTKGAESYYSDYADTLKWIDNGWVDYIVPQIYWKIGDTIADYSKLIKWWSEKIDSNKVDLYIGHGIYKDDVADEINIQMEMNKNYKNIKGSVFYTYSNILENRKGCGEKIKNYIKNNNIDNKVYYLDINSFLGEENVKKSVEKLRNDTGWYLEYIETGKKEPIFEVETGGFVGEESAKEALEKIRNNTDLDASYKFTGDYSYNEPIPIYRIETGGFVGEESAKMALKQLQDLTGWWAYYTSNGNIYNEYKIVTGGFVGEENVKIALKQLQDLTGWWAQYMINGDYIYDKTPIYSIKISDIIGENNAKSILNKLQNLTGWWAHYYNTNNYVNYYKIITGGFVGIDNVKAQSELIRKTYGWYNEIKIQ